MKKIIGILIAIATFLGIQSLAMNVWATETTVQSTEVTYINPLYDDVLSEENLVIPSIMSIDDVEYYTTIEAAGEYLREQMKERSQSINACYKTSELGIQDIGLDAAVNNVIKEIFAVAVMHTGNPTEGDYLFFQCGGYRCPVTISRDDVGNYILTFSFTITYYTTLEMENQVNEEVNSLLASLNINQLETYEKVKAVYDWICTNVTYDYDGLGNIQNVKKYTAYGALTDKTAVCQGYSVLLYRLLLELGIDSRIVTGNDESHAWNIVKLGARYYNADATWDCNFQLDEYMYFLKSMEGFTEHTRDSMYAASDFMNAYPMGKENYNPYENYHPIPEKPYRIVNVVSGPHVYWKAISGVEKYGVWRSENGIDGTYKWLGNPTAPHFTDVKVESGKAYYYKITAVVDGEHSNMSESIGITYVATPDLTQRFNSVAGVTVGWNKIEGATGYAIYRKTGNADWSRVATINGNNTFSWVDNAVKNSNGAIYKYTIRALTGKQSNTLSGCRSAGRTMVRLSSRTLNSAVKTGKNSIKCTWTTSSAVSGYEVRFMAGTTVYKTVTIGNYKTGVKTVTDLPAGKTYKIQVRSYKKVDGVGSFYSAWSTAKNVGV